ncbi:hypothetical protein NKR23_g2482 [Pleurostoma richardsiae]|uniref:Mitochondrial K+-H+ exchange-related-domain-containing protein n=1 Tax=Pleurostoma richardsiae TaxID=41990 RepID=A0AA38VV05_9PEZI|nr:hypothetical protein NKR23_g2482 [Pleurostoma richardsiae]
MRLFLLPISTRRTLLYAHRLNVATAAGAQQTWSEKIQSRASKTWADWEKKDGGWQKMVVNYGNYALRRIPYEEWGLKSVPPLSKKRRGEEISRSNEVEVVFPGTLIPTDRVGGVLNALSTERESLHKRKLVWCFVGMPLTIPIGILPLIPNLPFFYLVYRAWSHWRALAGGKHIQFLLQNNLLTLRPSPILDEVYAKQKPPLPATDPTTTGPNEGDPRNVDPKSPPEAQPEGEVMLLSQDNAKRMTQLLDLPQLEVELERAIWQVETAIGKQNEEKSESDAKDGEDDTGAKSKEDEKKSQ